MTTLVAPWYQAVSPAVTARDRARQSMPAISVTTSRLTPHQIKRSASIKTTNSVLQSLRTVEHAAARCPWIYNPRIERYKY